MTNNITICADSNIIEMIARHVSTHDSLLSIVCASDSYQVCLEASIREKSNIFILQAVPPITALDDLLIAVQGAELSPVYILFHVYAPGCIRYTTTMTTNPLAITVDEIFRKALKDTYACEHISYRTTLLNHNKGYYAETAGRHESLLEILRGCNQQEFLFYRDTYALNLKDCGYYLFFWELMGVEFRDHETNKYIYNFSGELLLQECYDIINRYNGGEVFYSTPNLLCIIINDLDINSEAGKKNKFDEMLSQLAYCTGNKVACRYLSERVESVKGLRNAYEKYHAEKSLSFFLRDMTIIRPALIEVQKQYTDIKTINALLHEITEYLRYDLLNPLLESKLHMLYFDILKPAMSFTLYYSSSAAIYNAIAEVQYSFEDGMPIVNNNPNLLQFTSIEEQYGILLKRIEVLGSQLTSIGRMSSALVLKTVNYIADNYAQEITVSEISDALFVSNVHLSQVFKREMGISIIKYLITYRIEQAKARLRETDEYIYEISENVGFREFRHFSKTFKEMTGLSPTQYRKQLR